VSFLGKLVSKMLNAAKKYNAWDYTWFKLTLCSLGILLGAYFSEFFLKYISIVWAVFIITYLWVIYKTLIKYKE
jgi:hypothetical protein